jgi:PAS domain S-box-containing protein
VKIRSSLLVLTAGALLSILIFSALVAAFLWNSTLSVTSGAALAMALAAALALVVSLLSWKLAHRISALADLSDPVARGVASPLRRSGTQTSEGTETARALHQAVAARRVSEARFDALAQLAPAGLFQTDAAGGYVYVNDRWSSITGVSAEKAAGVGWLATLHPDDRERVTREWHEAIRGQRGFSAQYRLLSARGDVRFVTDEAQPVRDEDGAVISYIGLITDITDLKRAADGREALLERTQMARVAAETASLAKDEFLGVVSHELRNPLNSIQLWLEVLRHQSGSPEQLRRAIEFIKRAADTQAKLMDDLLDIARIESGKLSMETTTVPLGPIVTAALDSVRLAIAAKGIVIDLRLDQAALAVTGDPVRLQQIAANLLSNAVKFTPRGGRVEVSLTSVGSSASLTIGDSGEGIAPDFLPHVFERFRQADTGSSRTAPGLGLGLSIARQLVELHGGRIWAESPGKGKGATFFVELPLAPIVRVLAGRQERAQDQPVPSIERFRVLVVEDEGGAREALGFLLRSAGAHVTTAASVPEALEILDEVRFDVLISDIGLPGQDGYDLMRQLRQRPAERGGRTPSIALTAYAGPENEQRALAAGYQIHLAKPIQPFALRQAIGSVARRELAADSADG